MPNDFEKELKQLEENYFGSNMHESAEIERLPEILDGVKCFVDVGASLGQYSYFASKALDGASFYLVEADPLKAERLRNLTKEWKKENGCEFEIVEKAASDKSEKITFFVPSDHTSSGAFFPLTDSEEGWDKTEVEADTIDSICKDLDVDFMKIDVEGAEYRALVGAKEVLERCDVRLLLEIAPWGDKERDHKPSDVIRLLNSYGYGFEIFENHYLFSKGNRGLKSWVKNRAMSFVLDRPGLKRHVKKVFNKLRGRK